MCEILGHNQICVIISLNLSSDPKCPLYRPGRDFTEVNVLTENQAESGFASRALALHLSPVLFGHKGAASIEAGKG